MEQELREIKEMLRILLQRTEPKKKPKQIKIKDTRTLEEQIHPYRGQYAPSMIEDFLLYWGEKPYLGDTTDENGNRLPIPIYGEERWKMEQTWNIKSRLERWKRQQDKWQYEREQKQQLKKVEETPVHRERRDTGLQSIGSLFNR